MKGIWGVWSFGGGGGDDPGTCWVWVPFFPSFQVTNSLLFSGCTVSVGFINFRNLVDVINAKINLFNVELGSPFVPRYIYIPYGGGGRLNSSP